MSEIDAIKPPKRGLVSLWRVISLILLVGDDKAATALQARGDALAERGSDGVDGLY